MPDKVRMPVNGGGSGKGQADGVNDPGRGGGGDSAGGSYQNPHTGKDGKSGLGGFFGHGGQTDIAYHGGGQLGGEGSETQNATTKGGTDASLDKARGPKAGPTGPDQDFSAEHHRTATINGNSVEIIETSGIAAAEASGTVGVEGQQTKTGEQPGSG